MDEILHQLVGSLSHYLQGFVHFRWCRISSINSRSLHFPTNVANFEPMEMNMIYTIWIYQNRMIVRLSHSDMMYQMYHNLSSTNQCLPTLPGLLPATRFISNLCMWWYTGHCICLHLQVEDPMHCAHSRKHSQCHMQNAIDAIMQGHKQQESTCVYNSLPATFNKFRFTSTFSTVRVLNQI